MKISPAVFQQLIDMMLADSRLQIGYFDDVALENYSCDLHAEHAK